MRDDRVRLFCHHCQIASPAEGCPGCAELRATWLSLAASHMGGEIPRPDTVERSGPGLVLTQRQSRGGYIAILVLSVMVLGHLTLVHTLSPRPEEIVIVLAVLAVFCLLGVFMSIRGLLHRVVLRLADGALTVTDRSKITTIPAASIAQLVVHANLRSSTHKNALRHYLGCQLLARTAGGDVPLLRGSLEDVRFIESLIERQLWIHDDPRHNVLTTSG